MYISLLSYVQLLTLLCTSPYSLLCTAPVLLALEGVFLLQPRDLLLHPRSAEDRFDGEGHIGEADCHGRGYIGEKKGLHR